MNPQETIKSGEFPTLNDEQLKVLALSNFEGPGYMEAFLSCLLLDERKEFVILWCHLFRVLATKTLREKMPDEIRERILEIQVFIKGILPQELAGVMDGLEKVIENVRKQYESWPSPFDEEGDYSREEVEKRRRRETLLSLIQIAKERLGVEFQEEDLRKLGFDDLKFLAQLFPVDKE